MIQVLEEILDTLRECIFQRPPSVHLPIIGAKGLDTLPS